MRDDFSVRVKETLARRAGMLCSNPEHPVPTSGPHDDPSKFVNVGVAAHITAASPAGKRYNPLLSRDERSAIANGIWLCQTCAKLIDDDEQHYTVAVLRQWKKNAEKSVRYHLEMGIPFLSRQGLGEFTLPTLHQLRAPVGDFVGRELELVALTQALCLADSKKSGIAGIFGMGGCGKTELAYMVAHRVLNHFSGAQLLLDLQGISDKPATPVFLLQQVIRAFEPNADLKSDLRELTTHYCSTLRGKKVLILADNANNAEQLVPLLPPAGCALLITGRSHFALPGMASFHLDTLEPHYSARLLTQISPRSEHLASSIARLCGHLPLALRLAANHLALDPTLTPEKFSDRLRQNPLNQLKDPTGSAAGSVEATIDVSYHLLPDLHQSVLRQVGFFEGTFREQAAILIPERPGDTDLVPILTDLVRRSLVQFDAASRRYRIHDLVRSFLLARLAVTEDFTRRFVEFHVDLAMQVATLFTRGGPLMVQALQVIHEDQVHLDLAWKFLCESTFIPDRALLRGIFMLGMFPIESFMDANSAVTKDRLKHRLHRAIDSFPQQGHEEIYAVLLTYMGDVYRYEDGRHHTALNRYEDALRIVSSLPLQQKGLIADHQHWIGSVEEKIAELYKSRADYTSAFGYYERVLCRVQKIGKDNEQIRLLETMARMAKSHLNDSAKSILLLRDAIRVSRQSGDEDAEASISWELGKVFEERGDYEAAASHFVRRITHLRKVGSAEAEESERHLSEIVARAYKQIAVPGNSEKQLDHFPGMPLLTLDFKLRLWDVLPRAHLLLIPEDDQYLKGADVKAYRVLVETVDVGRFTIRRTGQLIERNLLCNVASNSPLPDKAVKQGSFGRGSFAPVEPFQISIEWLRAMTVSALRFMFKRFGRNSVALYTAPVRRPKLKGYTGLDPSILRRLLWYHSKDTEYGFETARCEMGECTKLYARSSHWNSLVRLLSKDQPLEIYDWDIGGYCGNCDREMCSDHIELRKVVEKEMSKGGLEMYHAVPFCTACAIPLCSWRRPALPRWPRSWEELRLRVLLLKSKSELTQGEQAEIDLLTLMIQVWNVIERHLTEKEKTPWWRRWTRTRKRG